MLDWGKNFQFILNFMTGCDFVTIFFLFIFFKLKYIY